MVKRIYVEKKPPYAVAAKAVFLKIKDYLGIKSITGVRVLIRYDIENLDEAIFNKALSSVFSEPPLDEVYLDGVSLGRHFTLEYLPGQFDQRADSAEQALGLLGSSGHTVKCATTYILLGEATDAEIEKVRDFVLNPVDSRVASEDIPDTLKETFEIPTEVETVKGFKDMDESSLKALYDSLSLAMTFKDMLHIQNYYKEEQRDPTITEIRVFDTYWSDHCRHTTFSTKLSEVSFSDGPYRELIEGTFSDYKAAFNANYKDRDDKYVCLMDIATMAARELKKQGLLADEEDSEEINACSIVIPVDVDGKTEDWLLNFKNETHNHPTEIEPFGGAATCLGGAIRDPLSGRTYCYQAMRVTGAADPTVPIGDTIPGKLPQERIVTEAAEGYSSYGNQIGLATGHVREIYHPGYAAKRMEIGAVMAAAPVSAVKRERPEPGDIIILLGGRTGRDGIGGATGSSKAHDSSSTTECGAEVQKGNAPTERKLQRLFRRKEASILIKRCNDFGAGGVSVAIGELAEGLSIDLDKVPKKYAGLDGTELAISESQERMAVVCAPKDVDAFLLLCEEENLEATVVAEVTKEKRLVISWNGKNIVDVKRSFLDTNGAMQETKVSVPKTEKLEFFNKPVIKAVEDSVSENSLEKAAKAALSDLNVCSQKGLIERFDSSIGAGTVTYPFGGKYLLTPTQSMVAKIPTEGHTNYSSIMAYGFDPYLSSESPYHGAAYAVVSSLSKIVSSGYLHERVRFSFQEYFPRLGEDSNRWAMPFSALLGAYKMQKDFGLPAIGGKDSMSGSFNDMDVPPTLVSFAISHGDVKGVITPELKKSGSSLYLFDIAHTGDDIPDTAKVRDMFLAIEKLNREGKILSAYSLDAYGIFSGVFNMAIGNKMGVDISEDFDLRELFIPRIGSIIVETDDELSEGVFLGRVTDNGVIKASGESVSLGDLVPVWESKLDSVFPILGENTGEDVDFSLFNATVARSDHKFAAPGVFIPVFPGTNCEYDLSKKFVEAGANVDIKVLKNLTEAHIEDSINVFKNAIDKAQIIMFPGGFSAGDEPEGSAKFFSATFKNQVLMDALGDFLSRGGLMLGICNGFQALIKLGLLPNGKVAPQDADSATLTYNTIGRHIARIAYTKVVSNNSPWLMKAELGKTYGVPISHGEGRFVAPMTEINRLYENGQVATRYVGVDGDETNDSNTNPNGSFGAIEGILSPDGHIFGKMGHIERTGDGIGVNVYGDFDMKVFESGVEYFK